MGQFEALLAFIPRYYLVCFALSIAFGEIRVLLTFRRTYACRYELFGHPLAAEYVTFAAVQSTWLDQHRTLLCRLLASQSSYKPLAIEESYAGKTTRLTKNRSR
jgi:hypothetical protein